MYFFSKCNVSHLHVQLSLFPSLQSVSHQDFHFLSFYFLVFIQMFCISIFGFWVERNFIWFSPVRNTSPVPPLSVRATGKKYLGLYKKDFLILFLSVFVSNIFNFFTFLPKIWLIAALSFNVHSATTWKRYNFISTTATTWKKI